MTSVGEIWMPIRKPYKTIDDCSALRVRDDKRYDLTDTLQVAVDPTGAVLREQAFALQSLRNRTRILYSVPDLFAYLQVIENENTGKLTFPVLYPAGAGKRPTRRRFWLASRFGLGFGEESSIRNTITFDINYNNENQKVDDIIVYRSLSRTLSLSLDGTVEETRKNILRSVRFDGTFVFPDRTYSLDPILDLQRTFSGARRQDALGWLDLTVRRAAGEMLAREGSPAPYAMQENHEWRHSSLPFSHAYVGITQPLRSTLGALAMKQFSALFGFVALPGEDVDRIISEDEPAPRPEKTPRQNVFVNRRAFLVPNITRTPR